MKHLFLLTATLAVSLALPTFAQTSIPAPVGWKTQTRDGGATTFTPPDLRAGEKYSVTIYDAKPLGGKSLEAYLRAFAGPVGNKPGQLAAPLESFKTEANLAASLGVYRGPNGTQLQVGFFALSLDGENVRVMRTLFSKDDIFWRYQGSNEALKDAMARGARHNTAQAQGSPAPAHLPDSLPDMKVGGALVPGIYSGPHQDAPVMGMRSSRDLRIQLYPNGEYRICNEKDETTSTGQIQYDRARGTLDIDAVLALSNDKQNPGATYCYYGRNAAGKPLIYGQSATMGATILFLRGPLTNRKSPNEEAAPARLAKAARDAIPTRVAPGKGVPAAQIAAIVHNFEPATYIPGVRLGGPYAIQTPDQRTDATDEAYLLLRDGTLFRGLEHAPDQFDIAASRRKEPENWGLWKQTNGKIQVSFGGKPYELLEGEKMSPSAPDTRLSGRYKATNPEVKTAITFTSVGRFQRARSDAKDDPRAPFLLSKATKTVAGGELSGTYLISGYAITLRYDNGAVERMPFFFSGKTRQTLWFEGHQMALDEAKSKSK